MRNSHITIYACAFKLGLFTLFFCYAFIPQAQAATTAQKLSGRILIQVQSRGEAWYVHPLQLKRYYLGNPESAFAVMRSTGLGVTDKDIGRIAVAGSNSLNDTAFARQLSGRVLIRVQGGGEAWYVYPVTLTRYYLGRPADALQVMRSLGLGIDNLELGKIEVSPLSPLMPSITHDTVNLSLIRSEMLSRVNQERQKAGLGILKINERLNKAAQAHADDMRAQNYFSHTSRDGRTPASRMVTAGYVYSAIAENIAQGQSTVREAMDDWMASTGHRTNILNARYQDIGIGFSSAGNDPEQQYWVQDFGRAR